MKIFYTTNTQHLRIKLPLDYGKATIARFSDGEIFVKIEEDVQGQTVWVVAATPAPADNYFELFLLLDALRRAGAQINLLITYFGYARQDKQADAQSLGAQVVSNFLQNFELNKTVVIHAHSDRLHDFLKFENHIPYELFYPIAKKHDVIVAPDHGAQKLAQKIGKECDRPVVLIEKTRSKKNHVAIGKITGDVKDKSVLIVDDMICTGGTIISVAEKLKEQGAHEINVMATHGIFAGDAQKKITASDIKKIYITNSMRQAFTGKKIEVVDIAPVIEKTIKKP